MANKAQQKISYVKRLSALPDGTQFQELLEGNIFNLPGSNIFYMKIKFNQSFYVVNLQTGIAQGAFTPTMEILSRKGVMLNIVSVRQI